MAEKNHLLLFCVDRLIYKQEGLWLADDEAVKLASIFVAVAKTIRRIVRGSGDMPAIDIYQINCKNKVGAVFSISHDCADEQQVTLDGLSSVIASKAVFKVLVETIYKVVDFLQFKQMIMNMGGSENKDIESIMDDEQYNYYKILKNEKEILIISDKIHGQLNKIHEIIGNVNINLSAGDSDELLYDFQSFPLTEQSSERELGNDIRGKVRAQFNEESYKIYTKDDEIAAEIDSSVSDDYFLSQFSTKPVIIGSRQALNSKKRIIENIDFNEPREVIIGRIKSLLARLDCR